MSNDFFAFLCIGLAVAGALVCLMHFTRFGVGCWRDSTEAEQKERHERGEK